MRKNIIITVLLLMAITTNTYASVLGIPIEGGFFMNIGGESYLYQNLYRSPEENVGQQTEHYIEYIPNSDIVPVVSSGGKLFGKRTILEAYEYMRAQGLTPVAGINADFFSFKTGVPMSNTIINGELVTKESEEQHGIGFYDDGTAFIGWMDFQTTLITENQTIDIYNVNKYRQPYTIYLMNDEFSDTTENDTPGLDVILGEVSGPLKLGGEVTAVVEDIIHNEGAMAIPEGKLVLTIDDAAFPDLYAQVSALKKGEKVTIKSEAMYDDRWNNVSHAIGCIGGRLVENGAVCGDLEEGSAPRTAVGIKADGGIVFYTIDGRQQGYSHGVTLETLAMRMIELGCVDAVNLDGGGSTVIAGVYPGSDTLSVINLPSDGYLRKSANYIFLQKKSDIIPSAAPADVTPEASVSPKASAIPEVSAVPEVTSNPKISPTPEDVLKIDISENASEQTAQPLPETEYPEIDAEYADNLISVNVKSSQTVDLSIFIDGIDFTADANISDSGRTAVYRTDADFDKYIHRIKITAKTADGAAKIAYITTRCKTGYRNMFADTSGHWALEYISYMSDKGIVQGERQGNKSYFRPQKDMTRAEFAVMMANSLHLNLTEFENSAAVFEDEIPEWAKKHITAMYALGIIMGKAGETGVYFDPSAPITRAEAMTIIARTLPQNMRIQKMDFADKDEIPLWAEESIGKLVCMGAVSGYTDNTILPNKKITRAEGVKLLYEIY